jgi:hypothetical protein
MTKYKSFNTQKNKINYISEQLNNNTRNIENLKKEENFKSFSAKDFYKNAPLIYESEWINAELEKIPSAVSIVEDTLLPEKVLYDFSVDLAITEEFLPYLKIEVLAKTTPEMEIRGVFPYISTSYREILFQMYEWHGITFSSTAQPQPVQAFNPPPSPYGFIFPTFVPVPIGEDPTHVIPVGMNIIGEENKLVYDLGGSPSESWWTAGSIIFLHQIDDAPYNFPIEDAKEFILQYYNNIAFIEDETPNKAYEIRESNQVATGHQIKTFIKNTETNYNLKVVGNMLLISPANEVTSYSLEKLPTYQPHGGDVQVKLNIYAINPNSYSERKGYKNA